MDLQVIGVVICASLLTLLLGYNWGKHIGFDNGYETAENDYEFLGEFWVRVTERYFIDRAEGMTTESASLLKKEPESVIAQGKNIFYRLLMHYQPNILIVHGKSTSKMLTDLLFKKGVRESGVWVGRFSMTQNSCFVG